MEDAVLALAAASERIDTMDIIAIDPNELLSLNLALEENSAMDNPVVGIRNRHVDIAELTANKLNILAHYLSPKIRSEVNVFRFRKKKLQKFYIRL